VSRERAEVVGRLAGETAQVVAQAGICLGGSQSPDQLGSREPASPWLLEGDQGGHRIAALGDHDLLSSVNTPQ
jgi:hypothetical protein